MVGLTQQARAKRNGMFRRLAVLLSFLFLLGACGGEEEPQIVLPPPGPPAQPQVAAPAGGTPAGDANEVGTENDGGDANNNQVTRRQFDESNSRDPFQFPVPDAPISLGTGDTDVVLRDCNLEEHPLGETLYSDLVVTGLLTGTAVPRAMVRVRSNPQAVFIEENSQIGPRCSLRVTDIRDNELELAGWTAGDDAQAPIVIPLTTELLESEADVSGPGRDDELDDGQMWLCSDGDIVNRRSRCQDPSTARIVRISERDL